MYNYFSFKRFLLILRNDIISDYKSWLIYLLTIVGVYTGISLIEGAVYKFSGDMAEPNNLNYLFPGFLFLGGYIATSMTFEDVQDKFKSNLYLTLPGSTLEKYGSGVLISGIGYTVFLIMGFVLASIVSNAFTRPLFGMGLAIFNPFTLSFGGGISVWTLCLWYLLSFSMFLVGSIAFKKAAFIKTVLAFFVVQLALSLIFTALGYLFFFNGDLINIDFYRLVNFDKTAMETSFYHLFIWLGVALSLFFNIVAYLKLREKEVKGGI